MLEVRDPAFKLFGKTIPVTGEGDESPRLSNFSDQQGEAEKEFAEESSMETQLPDDDTSPPRKEECGDQPATAEADSENDTESQKDEKDSKEPKNSPLKKPDKILTCPRCNSMDTKFCYYNNYNVNQPRHFCKSCQRYWTAGGTMRNVPVGAGRRKNKSSSTSRYCHITVPEALQAARIDGVHHHLGLKTHGTILTFGSDNPLCESMASIPVPCQSRENDDHSSESTITTSSMDDGVKGGLPQEPINHNLNGLANQIPCFHQWPYMWNPQVNHVPPFCPSGFPMSFYPAPYFNAAIPWNVPWVSPCSPGSPVQKIPGSNPNSPTLGKHSRDGEMSTTTVLVPKTLRIDDPDEAAKSSIWTTLGINKEKGDHVSKRGIFNNLQTKAQENDLKTKAPPELQANPAALSRSINFQESASR